MRRPSLRSVALLLGVAVFFTGLAATRGLHQNDEDHYLGITRVMVSQGDYIVPHWDGQPTFTKPPLLYWLMAASMRIFGTTLFAARVPVALTALLTMAAVYEFGRRLLRSDGAAATAALLTGTTVGFLQHGRVAMMEVPLALLLVCSAWAAWRISLGSSRAWYALALSSAASAMLKGPATALIPLMGTAIWLAVRRRDDVESGSVAWRHAVGAALFFVLLLGAWPLALWARGMYGVFHEQFIVGENLGKFNGGRNPVTGMVGGFLALLAPWTLLVIAALGVSLSRPAMRGDNVVRLLLSFAGANLMLYCLPAIKWSRYLLPSIPLLALLVIHVAQVTRDRSAGEPAPDGPGEVVPPEPEGVFASLPVLGPLKAASVATGVVLMLVVPLLALGTRLLPTSETRIEMFVLALAVALTALCLLHGSRLFGAAASLAVALVMVSLLAPDLALDQPPPEAAALVRGQTLTVYAAPPYRYEILFGCKADSCADPNDFRERARKGGVFIVGDTELKQIMRAGAFDPSRAELLAGWKKWRRDISISLIAHTIVAGELVDLTENVSMMATH